MSPPHCFLAGTSVRTVNGERPIETLSAGDMIVTRREGFDGLRPIRWIGRNRVSDADLRAEPLQFAPIRIRAGALGENSPSRDLLLSPCHALLFEGLLIQAQALVNGASVTREVSADTPFVYYHVELDSHALILAENVEAETFLESVGVLEFDNWRDRAAPDVSARAIDELPFPRVTSARQLPQHVCDALAARAAWNAHGRAAKAA